MDWVDIYFWSAPLVGPVALTIGLISLRGYLLFRNWKFLFLSMAFILISIKPLLDLLLNLNLFANSRLIPFWQSREVELGISILAFMLLAFLYTDEQRTSSIKISKLQWVAFAILAISYPVIGFINVGSSFWVSFSGGYQAWISLLFVNWIFYVIILIVIMSLLAHYRIKRSSITILSIVGFICILLGYAYPLLSTITFLDSWPGLFYLGFAGPVTLFGYVLILVAIIQTRVSHG
jgi:hypothetical protein